MLPKKTKRTRIAEAEAEMMLKKKIHQDRMDEKGAILDKEFELCVHQEKVESLASSKLPENKLVAIYNDVCAINNERTKRMNEIDECLDSLDREETNFDKRVFSEENANLNKILRDSKNLIKKSVHPSYFPVQYRPLPETLEGRVAELSEKYDLLQQCLEMEGNQNDFLDKKCEELQSDKMVLTSKLLHFKKLSGHASKRFNDLTAMVHLAKIRKVQTQNTLAECKEVVSEAEQKENQYTESLRHTTELERQHALNEKDKMSELLIKIEDGKKLNAMYEHRLEMLHNYEYQLETKRSDADIAKAYMNVLNRIEEDYLKTEESTDRNVSIISESSDGDVDKPKKSSKKTSHRLSVAIPRLSDRFSMRMSLISSPLSDIRKRSSTITAEKSSALINPSRSMEDNPRFKTLKNFYKNHKDGPDELVDRIILKFTQLVFREMSLRNSYEDLMNQKVVCQNNYENRLKILAYMKGEKLTEIPKKPEQAQTEPVSANLPLKKMTRPSTRNLYSPAKRSIHQQLSEKVPRIRTRQSSPSKNSPTIKRNENDLLSSPGLKNRTASAIFVEAESDRQNSSARVSEAPGQKPEDDDQIDIFENLECFSKATLEENHDQIFDYIQKRQVTIQSDVVKIYLDVSEILYRNNNDTLPAKIESQYNQIFSYLRDLRGQKKGPQQRKNIISNSESKANLDSNADTLASLNSDPVKDEIQTALESEEGSNYGLNMNDVKTLYFNYFGQPNEKMKEKVNDLFAALRSNVFINTFVSAEEVEALFRKNALPPSLSDENILPLQTMLSLEEIGTQNLAQRFKTIFQYYTDLVTNLIAVVHQVNEAKLNDTNQSNHIHSEDKEHHHIQPPETPFDHIRSRKPFDLGEFNQNAQDSRARELLKKSDNTPREKIKKQELFVASSNPEVRTKPLEKITFSEIEHEIMEKKDLNSRISNLSMKVLKKKRGYFFSNIQYEFHSRAQRDQEEFSRLVLEKQKIQNAIQTEEGYFKNEREIQRQKTAEIRDRMLQGEDAQLQKEANRLSESDRATSAKTVYDHAMMKAHSQTLSQIKFLEHQSGSEMKRPKSMAGTRSSLVLPSSTKNETNSSFHNITKPSTAASMRVNSIGAANKSALIEKFKINDFMATTATTNTTTAQKKSRYSRDFISLLSPQENKLIADVKLSNFQDSSALIKRTSYTSQKSRQALKIKKKDSGVLSLHEGLSTEVIDTNQSRYTTKENNTDFKIRRVRTPNKTSIRKRKNLSQICTTEFSQDLSTSKGLFDVLYRGPDTVSSYNAFNFSVDLDQRELYHSDKKTSILVENTGF